MNLILQITHTHGRTGYRLWCQLSFSALVSPGALLAADIPKTSFGNVSLKNRFYRIHHVFRHSPLIQLSSLVKLWLRKEKSCSPSGKQLAFRKPKKKRNIMSNSNNNQINISQAREAMDRFKMYPVQYIASITV